MATDTRTSTIVREVKHDFPENGLYEVIKVYNPNRTTERRDQIIGWSSEGDNYRETYTVEKCMYYDVYLKPVNGSIINLVSRARLSEYHVSSSGTNQDDYSNSWKSPDIDGGEEYSWEDVSLEAESWNRSTQETDYHFDGAGCLYIGEEYEEKYTCTRVEEIDWDEDSSYKSYDEDVDTYIYEVQGETDYIDVKINGNKSADKFIYYSYDKDDYQKTYVLRVTPSKQTYTNVVAFNERYETGGSDLPSYFQIFPTTMVGSVSNRVSMLNTNTELNKLTNAHYNLLDEKSSELDAFEQRYDVKHSDENKIKSMLIYVDKAFAVFTPSPDYRPSTKKHYFYSTYKEAKKYEESYIKQYGAWVCLQTIPCYDLLMRSRRTDKYLYLSSQDFSNKQSSPLQTRVSTPMENIPTEHRWIQLLGMTSDNKITGYNAIVRIVSKTSQSKIRNIAVVESWYVRSTDYWFAKTYQGKNDFVIPDDIEMSLTPNNKIENRIYYPIVKPWAAVHMNVFPEEKENEAFGITRTNNWKFNLVNSKLKEKFLTDVPIHDIFFIDIFANADSDFDVVDEKVKEYGRTISPFRVETFTCHGCRKEYDKDSQASGNGRNSIVVAKKTGFKTTGWNKIHDISSEYNASIFSNEHMYWNVFVESCFGQGIKSEQARRNDINSIFINSTGDVLPGRQNAFAVFDAVGTHVGYGEPDSGMYGCSTFMCKLMSDTITYQELSDNFNNWVKRYKEQTFNIIRDFYDNNFSEMLFCLKDENTRQEWLETKDMISEDLSNQGRRYFAQYDWEKTRKNGNPNPNYWASGNYFDIEGKKYRINDGFIGLIKDAMCNIGNNNPWKCFKEFDNPQGGFELLYRDMVYRCRNNIIQCGKDIWNMYRNAIQSTGQWIIEIATASSIVEPRMFVSGKLKNAKFLDYPEEEAEMKKWLTSDDDLVKLYTVSLGE